MIKPCYENKKGFTLLEMIIVASIILVLVGIAIPNFVKALANTRAKTCIDNLRQIALAKQQWALENNKGSADSPQAADLNTYIKGGTGTGTTIYCPLDTTKTFSTSYTINDMSTNPACLKSPATHNLN